MNCSKYINGKISFTPSEEKKGESSEKSESHLISYFEGLIWDKVQIEVSEFIYEKEKGLQKSDDIIAYCRIGERSSHTWFVLTYLLGYENVRNYDGSWTEWGNTVRAPIEMGAEK